MTQRVLVLNGPNLNLLGTREPERYGTITLTAIEQKLSALAAGKSGTLCFRQTNSESEMVGHIHTAAVDGTDFIIINPAAFTHTSVAVRDALKAVNIPFIEVHLSNIHAREAFRQHSYLSDGAIGVISGLGATGYELALTFALEHRG